MPQYLYGKTEIDHLCRCDDKLAEAIARIGLLAPEITPDLFSALVRSIVNQQVSGKVARTLLERLRVLAGEIAPERIAALLPEQIRTCGLSFRKAGYILGAAQAALEGRLDAETFRALDDGEVCRRLMALPGVGRWTAEMLMIFSLGRPDVVSYGDLAIRRGIMRLYGVKELSLADFEHYRNRYSPYGTVASFYLWRVAHEEVPVPR